MAQHDYDISNQTFPSFRSDLNSVLEAINTSNSGTSRPSSAVAGTIWLDTTNATNPTLKLYDGADDISLATFDYSANTVNWLDSSVSFDIVNDLSPQLGAMLDVNGNAIGNGTEELIKFSETASAVNEITVTNSATGNAPEISATGDDTNIDFKLTPKGTGKLVLDGLNFPTADGTADQVLKTDGSGNLSFTDVSGGTDWQSSIKTANFTAVAGEGYWINTTSSAVTMTLPSSASVGDTVEIVDYARTWGTNNVTIDQNGLNFQGFSSPNPEYNTNGQSVRFVYSGSTKGWIPTVDDDVTDEVPQIITVDYLVIAGGGGGSADRAGAGGAGGYRNSYLSESSGGGGSSESSLVFDAGTTYTITVGAGGTGAVYATSTGTNGSDSSLSGTGITTITSTGGGKGGGGTGVGGFSINGFSGGSGGGGGGANGSSGTGGSGTANQGFDGGDGAGGSNPNNAGGGGGGASAVGSDASNSDGGNGGNGLASSITGSSVTRGGGGGGGCYNDTAGTGGTGGTGGGGDGADSSGSSTAGTSNTGGGGGAGNGTPSNGSGANGGSGVVILRLATSNYSGTTTGSPTVTTDGTDTILTFTASGSYTA